MDRIAFFLLMCLFSCKADSLPEHALFTMLNHGGERVIIARYPDRGGYTSSLFILRNDAITDTIVLGHNDFFMFTRIESDTVYMQKLIQVTQQEFADFIAKDTTIKFTRLVLSLKSQPYFGAGAKGIKNCEIKKSIVRDTTLYVECPNGSNEYSLANIYFTDNSIYYYELKDGGLKSSFLGYQKKIYLTRSP